MFTSTLISVKLRRTAALVMLSVGLCAPLSAQAFDWNKALVTLQSFTFIANILSLFNVKEPPIVPVQGGPVRTYGNISDYEIPTTSVTRYNGPSGDAMYEYGSSGNYQVSDTAPSMDELAGPASDLGEQGPYAWPVKGGSLSSTYGMRERTGKMCHSDDRGDGTVVNHCGVHMHNGLDIAVPENTPVQSVSSGKVVWISPDCNRDISKEEGGCVVSVMTPSGELSTYMHLDDVADGVHVGSVLNAGDPLAESGNSGTATTGAHLHFEMCQVSPDMADGKTNPYKLCTAKGSTRIDPLTKLSSDDQRFAAAVKKNIACLKKGTCTKSNSSAIVSVQQVYTPPETVQTMSSPSNFQGL
jgi:murein DD-endopeptidase MepM/ murein hydrolase activator NlpD